MATTIPTLTTCICVTLQKEETKLRDPVKQVLMSLLENGTESSETISSVISFCR